MEQKGFDVNATIPAGTTKEEFRLMLQNLLIERFGLRFHREMKTMPAYELVIASSRPKLQQYQPEPDETPPPFKLTVVNKDGFPVLPAGNRPVAMAAPGGRIGIRARNESSEEIATRLSNVVGKPVIDHTGLKETYDYTLFYQITNLTAQPAGPASDITSPIADHPDLPTIFQAIEKQLGLKLQTKKLPVSIFVIDYAIADPTPN